MLELVSTSFVDLHCRGFVNFIRKCDRTPYVDKIRKYTNVSWQTIYDLKVVTNSCIIFREVSCSNLLLEV